MMALQFSLVLIVTLLAWFGYRRSAVYLMLITIILAIALFAHHMTSTLNLNL